MSRYQFGPFVADTVSGELFRDGTLVAVQDLPFRLLASLLERPGELVTRAELTAKLWGSDTYVDAAAGLNTAVGKLRDALGDDPDAPKFIETVPKRGYRFVAAVETEREGVAKDREGFSRATVEREGIGRAEKEREGAAKERDGFSGAGNAASRSRRSRLIPIAATLALIVVVAGLAYQVRANRPKVRVAVTLFDNETGETTFDRVSQGLTDATVFALTAEPPLAVIGNAAVLRTSRPFRDLSTIRDALHTDYIVVGQVQRLDNAIIVRTHLIRSADQSHLWVAVTNLTDDGEAALQTAVADRVTSAVKKYAISR